MPPEPAVTDAPKQGGFLKSFNTEMGFSPADPNQPPAAPAAPKPPEPAAAPAAPAKPALPSIGKPSEPAKAPEPPKPDVELLSDEPPQGLSPKASESWKALREKANTIKREALTWKEKADLAAKELETLKKTPAQTQPPPEFETIKKERDEFSNELKRVRLERHPDFKKHYDGRLDSAVTLAKEAVGKDHADKVAKLLRLSDTEGAIEQLEAIASGLSPLKAGQLANAITAYKSTMQEKEGLLSKADAELQAWEQTQAQQGAKSQELMQQNLKRITEKSLELSSALEVFTPKEGDEAHNAAIAAKQQFVRDYFAGKASEELVAWTPALAAEAMYLKETKIPAMEAELKKRDDIIAQYTKGNPSVHGDGGGKPAAGGKKSFMSVWNEQTGQS